MNKLPFNPTSSEDIPAARRQPTKVSPYEIENAFRRVRPRKKRRKLLVSFLTVAILVGLCGWQWDNVSSALSSRDSLKDSIAASDLRLPWDRQTKAQPGEPTKLKAHPETLLNHHHYEEAPANELVPLNPNSEIKLMPAAQASVNAMIAKAKADGVQLGVISGFRSLADQDYLYFKVKAERGESAKARAEVSAPPGYSEHHTGYAVDLIDESQPATYVEESFVTTPAYRWLMKNAAFFNFEMSFPQNNKDLVAYEPWHWRYVGDQKSLELFYGDQQ